MIRIVHLQLALEHCADFESFVHPRMPQIATQPGCRSVQLLKGAPGHYFTVSDWESEIALNAYRESALFDEIWPTVKPWFSAKAEAWTTEEIPF